MGLHRISVLLGAASLFGIASVASADTIVTWNTCEGGGDSICSDGSPPAPGVAYSVPETPRSPGLSQSPSYTFTQVVDALARNLVATAYSTDTEAGGATTTALNPAELKVFGGGLGVRRTAGSPDETTSAPNHATDNIAFDEMILFRFSEPNYKPLSFMTGWNCNYGTDGDRTCESGGTSDIVTLIGNAADEAGFVAKFLAFLQTGVAPLGTTAQLFDDVAVGVLQSFANDGMGEFLMIASASGMHGETITTASNVTPPNGLSPDLIPEANDNSSSARTTYCSSTYAADNRALFGSTRTSTTGDGEFKCTWREVIPDANDDTADARSAYCASTYAGTGRVNFRSQSISSSGDGIFRCKWDEKATVMVDGSQAFKLLQITGVLIPPRVAEPGTLALLGLGMTGLYWARRRRRP